MPEARTEYSRELYDETERAGRSRVRAWEDDSKRCFWRCDESECLEYARSARRDLKKRLARLIDIAKEDALFEVLDRAIRSQSASVA